MHRPVENPVGSLAKNLPSYVIKPPVEAVVFSWGSNEDYQLGLDTEPRNPNVYTPKVCESLLGCRFMGRSFGRTPLVAGSRNTLAIDSNGQVCPCTGACRLARGQLLLTRLQQQPAGVPLVHASRLSISSRCWSCVGRADHTHRHGGPVFLIRPQVWSWGWNDRGTLGLGHRAKVRVPAAHCAHTCTQTHLPAGNTLHCT